jgi:hypothetical protein
MEKGECRGWGGELKQKSMLGAFFYKKYVLGGFKISKKKLKGGGRRRGGGGGGEVDFAADAPGETMQLQLQPLEDIGMQAV